MDFTALQNSPFLQSLGWAIANSLWQAAALWVAYLIVNVIYRNASATFKNSLSTILLSSAFVWFCVTFFSKFFAIESTGTYTGLYLQTGSITATEYNWAAGLNKLATVLPYLSAAYLLLLIFFSARLINVYRYTRFIKFDGLQKPGPEWKLFAEKVASHMGITKKIRLWVSSHIDVPATIGFFKPVILIPLASINQLSTDQMEAIILHELSHIKRNDYLINLGVSIIETILFFNPFVVLLSRIIKRERENCCDDFVIQFQYDRHAYASALLSLEQFRNINLRLAIGATAGKKQLLQRIKRIMEINQHTNFNYGQKLVTLLLITAVISSVAWLSPQNNEQKKEQANTIVNKVYEVQNQREPTAEAMLVKAKNNAGLKGIPVKIQAKRFNLRNGMQLKALRDLTLQETAQREDQRLNLLLQESKKEVGHKKSFRLNFNRFFMARTTPHRASLFELNNQWAMASGPISNANTALQQLRFNSADLKKLQAELENARFSYSFDFDKIQEAIKVAINSTQLQKRIHQIENKKKLYAEKISRTEITIPDQHGVRHLIINSPEVRSNSISGSVYLDTAAFEINNLKERIFHGVKVMKKVVVLKENASDQARRSANSYAYGYQQQASDDDPVNKNSASGRMVFRRMPAGRLLPATTLAITTNDNQAQAASPKTKSNRNNGNVRVEYKNGILYINGKLVNLPDAKETLAQFSVTRQKTTASDKQLDIIIND